VVNYPIAFPRDVTNNLLTCEDMYGTISFGSITDASHIDVVRNKDSVPFQRIYCDNSTGAVTLLNEFGAGTMIFSIGY
jgi:hypothetical protein